MTFPRSANLLAELFFLESGEPKDPQEQMNYFMGASRARQLLAVFHKANRGPIEMAYLSW